MRTPNLRSFLQWSVGTCIVLYTLLVFALNNTRVQTELGHLAEQELGEILHTKVTIGRVEVGLLNSISLHDVKLQDQEDKELLNSKLIFAKLQIRSLLQGKIYLRNIALLDADIHIYKSRPDGPTNLQFMIDAFSSKKSTGPSKTDLRINSLIVRRGNVTYDEWYRPRPVGRRFSPHHIDLSDVDANLTLKHFTRDSLSFRIRHFAAREACGWEVKRLGLRFEGNRKQCTIRDLELLTPHSAINQELLQAHYDLDAPTSLFSTLSANFRAINWQLSTADLAPVLSRPLNFRETLRLDGLLSYTPQRIKANDSVSRENRIASTWTPTPISN